MGKIPNKLMQKMYSKRLLILSVVSLSALSFFGQNKINLQGKALLRELQSAVEIKGTDAAPTMIEAIVTFNDGWDSEILNQYGAENVTEIFENVVVASLPADLIEAFAENESVDYVEFGRTFDVKMDFARKSSTVDNVHAGFDYDGSVVSYTGKGVVAGLMDTGIDPNHVNFTDATGTSRVKEAYDFNKNISAVTPTAVKRFTTDTSGETHGTHVAGIMTGAYNREGEYTYMSSATARIVSSATGNIPYYGVATGADVVMSGGSLTNANILKGIANIVNYGKAAGIPAVVNLSLGSNDGPHDGTGALEQSISKYAKDAIICVAAGNEGDSKMFAGKKFTEDDTVLKTIVQDGTSSGIDIWTNSSEPVTVSIGFYASLTRKFTPFATVTEAGQTVAADNSFKTSMSGSCVLSSEVNVKNNRYHVLISGSFQPSTSRNSVAIQIEGKAGQEVYVYGFGNSYTSFTSNSIAGFTDGTTDGTISGLACAEGVIAVGSYTTRSSWPTFAGAYSYNTGSGLKVGEISSFSSYGSSYQGESLPHVSAPGAAIVSSFNRYYTNSLNATSLNSATTAKVVPATGHTHYWGATQGTSMACPYVAGTVALWLEADPTLTAERVIEIFKTTSVASTSTDPLIVKQWGAGKLDALEGIKEVLRTKGSGGVEGIIVDSTGYVITPEGDRAWNVIIDGASRVDATLYNLQGIAVAHAAGEYGEVTLDASSVAPGVYMLTVTAPNSKPITQKVALK